VTRQPVPLLFFFKMYLTVYIGGSKLICRWGFQRIPRGPETGAYYHKLFRRDKPELILQMASNSDKKFHPSPLQHLLPNIQSMAAPTMGMFPYMPPQAAMMPVVTPQQQLLWQQQMQQMMQFQQMMQIQQQQAMQQAAVATATAAQANNMGAPMQQHPMNQMMMMMMQPSQQTMQIPSQQTSQINTMTGGIGGGIDLGDQQRTTANTQSAPQDNKSDLVMNGGGLDLPTSFEGV
jgi:hypothetical protein